ncbi:MAG: Rid family hydrolase [Actinomycetota bacterium]|nr:Rid family hydrolase [Actinomycetota bacterium]
MVDETVDGVVRHRSSDGGAYEVAAGYSRAVAIGNLIAVSATGCEPSELSSDTYGQTRSAFQRVLAAIADLGGSRAGVVRTRLYLAPEAKWQEAARAHADLFGDLLPANATVYVAGLIGDGVLVEAEADCWKGDAG